MKSPTKAPSQKQWLVITYVKVIGHDRFFPWSVAYKGPNRKFAEGVFKAAVVPQFRQATVNLMCSDSPTATVFYNVRKAVVYGVGKGTYRNHKGYIQYPWEAKRRTFSRTNIEKDIALAVRSMSRWYHSPRAVVKVRDLPKGP